MWLQIGKHGESITQASKVRIVTKSSLPMQVDGEPCILESSEINIELRNKSTMIVNNHRSF